MNCEIRWHRLSTLSKHRMASILVVKLPNSGLRIVNRVGFNNVHRVYVLGASQKLSMGPCIRQSEQWVPDELIELAWDYPKDIERFALAWTEYRNEFLLTH